jgi:vacuolar-type H+-ATPase subunit I/STV1
MIVGIILNLQVTRLRLLGDHVHSTRIAFVEFAIVSFHLQP